MYHHEHIKQPAHDELNEIVKNTLNFVISQVQEHDDLMGHGKVNMALNVFTGTLIKFACSYVTVNDIENFANGIKEQIIINLNVNNKLKEEKE